jgi:hypothetical protein
MTKLTIVVVAPAVQRSGSFCRTGVFIARGDARPIRISANLRWNRSRGSIAEAKLAEFVVTPTKQRVFGSYATHVWPVGVVTARN